MHAFGLVGPVLLAPYIQGWGPFLLSEPKNRLHMLLYEKRKKKNKIIHRAAWLRNRATTHLIPTNIEVPFV